MKRYVSLQLVFVRICLHMHIININERNNKCCENTYLLHMAGKQSSAQAWLKRFLVRELLPANLIL